MKVISKRIEREKTYVYEVYWRCLLSAPIQISPKIEKVSSQEVPQIVTLFFDCLLLNISLNAI